MIYLLLLFSCRFIHAKQHVYYACYLLKLLYIDMNQMLLHSLYSSTSKEFQSVCFVTIRLIQFNFLMLESYN